MWTWVFHFPAYRQHGMYSSVSFTCNPTTNSIHNTRGLHTANILWIQLIYIYICRRPITQHNTNGAASEYMNVKEFKLSAQHNATENCEKTQKAPATKLCICFEKNVYIYKRYVCRKLRAYNVSNFPRGKASRVLLMIRHKRRMDNDWRGRKVADTDLPRENYEIF